MTGSDPQVKAFASLWKVLDKTCEAEHKLVLREPQYVLDCAWRACGKAEIWQRVALEHSAAGRAANDRLDAAMRLFNYASGGESSGEFAARTIEAFIEQVRSLTIEADSLAHTAPIDQAVTLTTPAGAAGRHWNLVFLPSLQQGQWPNLTPRNTLFGGEELADVMLHGELSDTVTTSAGKRDAQLAAVLASEQKSFLVALTRADECAVMSAVLNDDHVPSDFLYGYVPEWFDRDRDADMEQREYAAIGSQGDYAGLESDPRGLIAAARSVLAMEPSNSPKARDAAETLALLASRGIRAADPDCWPFVEEPVSLAERETIQDGKTRQSDVVTLSPSAVDNLWACPVCWMLENRFSGPRMGSVATNFGSLIHTVAQKATEAGLDMPEQHTAISDMDNIDAITEQMYAEYERLRGDLNGITDPAQRYQALKKDEQAKDALRNIATYFVQSNHGDYPIKNNDAFSVGKLTKAEPELKFTAKFDFDDILAAYNAMDGIHAISRNELIAIMGTLVGGWPQTGMSEHLTVRLTGRIDRVERRDMADGTQQVRLIDYKTGASPNGEGLFNDLQLVCYQLGLVFPEGSGLHGAQAVAAAPNITQSALFHVTKHAFPAPYGNTAAESHMQQALFANGSLNTGAFVPRYYIKKLDKDFQDGLDEMLPPMEVSDEHWSEFVGLRNTMAVWSLTMIARVFYAAAASRANEITARPTSEHMKYCRNTAVCPACAGRTEHRIRKENGMSGTMKFTDSPEQAAVIQAPSYEDVVVVAGAGSGKTYTMTRRIITLIEQGVSPEKILGLTFTRKAASELLSRVSAAVSRNQRERGLKSANMTFLKPEVSTYDAFFQSIVRQYGLLVGFDQNTQPLSEAGAMQLIHTVLDKHMVDLMAFDGDLKSFNTIASNVFALSNAISGAMIGSGCTSFDEAVQRVRDWDEAFIRQVDKALDGETVPTEQPKSPKPPKRLKKDSDADYEKKLEKYRELGHSMCVYNSTQLASVAKQRNLLLDLVLDYHAEKQACNMAEFSDFTIAAFQLVSRFPSIGATYRKRYSHVLLDEYQDTSTTQAALLSALFHADDTHRSAVNAVGDPFQSIYAWRGASRAHSACCNTISAWMPPANRSH